MRSLRKNQQKLQYALQLAEVPEFETIYYEDGDGNRYPIDVKPTGKTEVVYGEPVDILSNIAGSGGEAEATMYGFSVSDYSAKLTLPKKSMPLKLGALIWYASEPQYKHIEVEVNDISLNGDYPERTSADYYVVGIPPCLDEQVVLLQAINK